MEFERLVDCFRLNDRARQIRTLRDGLPEAAPPDWRALAALLAVRFAEAVPAGEPVVLGISGGQGAGKTTLAALLVQALSLRGRRGVTLSIDDFYLPRRDRHALAKTVHPLLATRGVPGTHDVALAVEVIDAVRAGRPARCPVFDKAADDRLPAAQAQVIEPGVDLVIFEGWCVGAQAQPDAALAVAVNDLESLEDPDGHWRRFVNDRLAADYPALWRRLTELLYLQVPDMAAVLRWRTAQEQQHAPERRMNQAAIARFVAHYERLTRWMLETLPDRADMVGLLDENHALAAFRCAPRAFRVRSAIAD